MFHADLHVHSRHSRATAASCDLEHLALWSCKKGLALVGTGDFTHPAWLESLASELVAAEPGLFRLRPELERHVVARVPVACQRSPRFVLSVEISTIYKKLGRTRKVHHVVLAPDLEAARAIVRRLAKIGNLASDGRPILGLDSRDLLEIVLESSPDAYLIPAHVWTPWFSALGSQSGFDSIAECYGDLASHIFAIETGLSSDPEMNWRVSSLDGYRLVSCSDAHSPPMLGREASSFDCELDYFAIRRALEHGPGYRGTVELFPEEGKYHLDGHRNCGVRLTPEQTREHDGRCPGCGKRVTVGVLNRVAALADRPAHCAPPVKAGQVQHLVPLSELLGELHGVGPKSRAVERSYEAALAQLGPELHLLSEAPVEDVKRLGAGWLAEALTRLRAGEVRREAGFDGQYGKIRLFDERELATRKGGGLFATPAAPVVLPVAEQSPVGPPARTPAACEPRPVASTEPAWRLSGAGGDGELLAGLDPEQAEVVRAVDGAVLVTAGPGSGKTRVLTHRIAHLVCHAGAPPEQCLAITFTRRAAREMRERLARLLPGRAARITVATLHELGLRIVEEHAERFGLGPELRVADEREVEGLLGELLGLSAAKARTQRLAASRARRSPPTERTAEERALVLAQRELLRARGLVDFDDLVALPAELLEAQPALAARYQSRFGWISIDELQDLDGTQYRLLRLLAPPHANLCAIGDPDQAIYGFRGAEPLVFERFAADWPTVRRFALGRNYRSDGFIVRAAAELIGPGSRRERPLTAVLPSGRRLVLTEAPTERAEAELVVATIERLVGGHSFFSLDSGRSDGRGGSDYGFGDFAVLYRTDAQAVPLCEALQRSGIPYERRSHTPLLEEPLAQELCARVVLGEAGSSVHARLQGAALALLEAGRAREPVEALARELAPLAAGCGDDLGRWQRELALWQSMDGWDPHADRVSLLTLHAAKGLEFPVVLIVGCEQGLLPLRFGSRQAAPLEEERRLLYVGMTRARSELYLSWAATRMSKGKPRVTGPSPLLRAVTDELVERGRAELPARAQAEPSPQLDLFAR